MSWWGWALIAWGIIALLLALGVGRAIALADKREGRRS